VIKRRKEVVPMERHFSEQERKQLEAEGETGYGESFP
jgi:hypothetical protein